jgi:hypothetical protein
MQAQRMSLIFDLLILMFRYSPFFLLLPTLQAPALEDERPMKRKTG